MKIILDIETNLTFDTIWCVVCRDVDTDIVSTFTKPDNLQSYLDSADSIIAHNGIFFDFPVLSRIWNIQVKPNQIIDTLVLSRLYNPSLEDGHSLESWGSRLGFSKGDYKQQWIDKHKWNDGGGARKYNGYYEGEWFDDPDFELLLPYCIQDTLVTKKLFINLEREMKDDYSDKSKQLEHQVALIIAEQERNGFKLDERAATELLFILKTKLDAIQVEMQSIFPARVEGGRTHKTTGKPLKDIITPFNPGSRKQIAERLQEKGWKPKEFTEKGSVIVDETTLEGIDIPEAKAIAEYLMLQKRVAQVESWIDAVKPDGRVHGRVITNGAVTGRMTHMKPNMAQVPNSGAVYGPECRALWTVEKGNKLVGIDASGLELRMLAHYMKDNEYTNEVVSGDIHTANQKAAGLETRNQAKTFIYAFLYGAGAAKIGTVVGGSSKEGQKLIDSFLQNTPRLAQLKKDVAFAYASKGWVRGLDGRKLLVRSEHSALNTLLQGAGAIVMKQALVLLSERLKSENIYHKFCANVHDEWQIETKAELAETVGQYGVWAIEEAGKVLNMRCPLTGEYRTGLTWKDTH
jgi:DNA polymerase I-like protein with 3'-5' exonuclease and polymerase domains